MKKILVFSTPFGGHLTILNEFINKYSSTYDIKLVITGWTNIPPSNINLKCHPIILSKSRLAETDPALWTFRRVLELLPFCLKITKEYKPNLIFYDFFSLEGVYTGRLLGIPYWCSIPALIGPFTNQKYLNNKLSVKVNLESIKLIEQTNNLSIDFSEMETISDGIYIPGIKNIVWSYKSVVSKNFDVNRKTSLYHFVGNIRGKCYSKKKKDSTKNIYFSLGTVVMDNLWNQQKETREGLRSFILRVATLWENKDYRIIFSSQGKKVLDKYPSNWQVYDRVDQIKCLAEADVFITHGGSNSFHEALIQQVPMLVIPFFGDQPLVGKTVEDLGVGKNLVESTGIDTKKPKDFLSDELAVKLDKELVEILNSSKYSKRFSRIDLTKESLDDLLGCI